MRDVKLVDFIAEVASDDPTRGGGSVSALSGALGVGLLIMVSELMMKRADFEANHQELERIMADLNGLKVKFVDYIDKDSDAFQLVVDAYRLPRATDQEKSKRSEAIQKGFVQACLIPLEVVELVIESAKDVEMLLSLCPEAFISDARVGTFMLNGSFKGARENVLINLDSIKDQSIHDAFKARLEAAQTTWIQYQKEFALYL